MSISHAEIREPLPAHPVRVTTNGQVKEAIMGECPPECASPDVCRLLFPNKRNRMIASALPAVPDGEYLAVSHRMGYTLTRVGTGEVVEVIDRLAVFDGDRR